MHFTDKIAASNSTMSLIVIPVSPKNKAAWYFIEVDPPKLNRFHKDVFTKPVNLEHYGTVVHSGWGEQPPQEIVDEMIRDYGYKP